MRSPAATRAATSSMTSGIDPSGAPTSRLAVRPGDERPRDPGQEAGQAGHQDDGDEHEVGLHAADDDDRREPGMHDADDDGEERAQVGHRVRLHRRCGDPGHGST